VDAAGGWRWRLIILSVVVFALSFAVWVFTPPTGRYQREYPLLFDTRTGTLYRDYNRCGKWETWTTFTGRPSTQPAR